MKWIGNELTEEIHPKSDRLIRYQASNSRECSIDYLYGKEELWLALVVTSLALKDLK